MAILQQPIAKYLLAILATSCRLNEIIELVAFIGLGGVNNVFSHVSLIFVATSCIFATLLLTNFFALLSAALESNFLSRFLYPWHSKLVHRTCAPMFLAQNRGFFEGGHSWEPGSSLTTGESSLFRLSPKVSGANVRWTEHESYLYFSQKSLS
jgi:hypothetical protein